MTEPLRFIDSHVHLWAAADGFAIEPRQKFGAIDRDITAAELQREIRASGEGLAIVVEAASDMRENRVLLARTRNMPLVHGVIGWVDLRAPDREGRLPPVLNEQKLVGVRATVTAGTTQMLADPQVVENVRLLGEAGLVLDVLGSFPELAGVGALADQASGTTICLNHCGRPLTVTGEVSEWKASLWEIAPRRSVVCKLSGLIERAGFTWTHESLHPYIAAVFELFGPDRLLFGSNWPVCTLLGTYRGWFDACLFSFDRLGLSCSETEAVLRLNALRLYRPKTGCADR